MSTVEELQAKLEKSEAARQKLRSSLNLLKERALNTGELVKHHQALQGRLGEAEQRAQQERSRREQAESQLAALRREHEIMRSELQAVRQQAAQAARVAQDAQAQAGATSRAQQAQQDTLDRLKSEVAGLTQEVHALKQQLQAGGMPAALTPALAPKRGRGVAAADAGALAALKGQLGGLQEQYHAVHAELLRWKAALGGLAMLATGALPPEVPPGLPGGAEGSIMLAPLRVPQPAGVNESNVLDGTVDQGVGEHLPGAGPRFGVGPSPGLPAPGRSPTHATRPLSPGGGGKDVKARKQRAPSATAAAASADGAGGPDARQRAVAAMKAAGAAASVGTEAAPLPTKLRSPTRRQRPAAAAQQAQQARQAQAEGARPPTKRVRYMEPPAMLLAERPRLFAPTRPAAHIVTPPAIAVLAPAAVAPAAAETPDEGEEEQQQQEKEELEMFAEEGEGEGGVTGARCEPSLAVSANEAPADQAGPDRVAVQLGFITDDVAASVPLVHSVAAELARALLTDAGCPLSVVLSGFQSALLHCAGAALPPGGQLSPPASPSGGARSAAAAAAGAAGPWTPPHRWFQEQPQPGQPEQQQQQQQQQQQSLAQQGPGSGGEALPGVPTAAAAPATTEEGRRPSGSSEGAAEGCYAGVWGSPEALVGHKMRWLLLCALQLDVELSAHLPLPDHAGGPSPPGTPPAPVGVEGPHPPLQFCGELRRHLHRLVVAGCLGGGSRSSGRGGEGDMSPGAAGTARAGLGAGGGAGLDGGAGADAAGETEGPGAGAGVRQPLGPQTLAPAAHLIETELCALAAATAGLCRLAGDLQAFRAFLWDLMSIQAPIPGLQLPPLTAALEVWPEALPAQPQQPPGGAGAGAGHAAEQPAAAEAAVAVAAAAIEVASEKSGEGAAAAAAAPVAGAGEGSREGAAAAVELSAVHSKLRQLCLSASAAAAAAAAGAGRQAPGEALAQAGGPAGGAGSLLAGFSGFASGEGPSSNPKVLSTHRPAAAAVWMARLGAQWWGWPGPLSGAYVTVAAWRGEGEEGCSAPTRPLPDASPREEEQVLTGSGIQGLETMPLSEEGPAGATAMEGLEAVSMSEKVPAAAQAPLQHELADGGNGGLEMEEI